MSEIRKQLTMKAASEIFKLASKLNIKPKDVIGMGGDIVKMGQSLFTEKVNPKLLNFIKNKGEVPKGILEEIKLHIRTLKNASDNQVELFKLNLNDIVNAKFPPKADVIKIPVASHKKQATSVKELEIMPKYKETLGEWGRGQTFGTKEYYLAEIKRAYPNVKLTGQETKQELKEMILRLDTEGIPFSKGGIANHFRKK
jgi:hypothetical protein